jgi:hypothetical protein
LRTATTTTDRTTRLMNDFATMAQYGQTMADAVDLDFRGAVTDAWADVGAADVSLSVDGDGTVEADPAPFRVLLIRGFEFAVDNGASSVAVTHHSDGITVTDDGDSLQGDPERYFDYADAVSADAPGTALPLVRTLAEVHGWRATLDPSYRDGIRLRLSW